MEKKLAPFVSMMNGCANLESKTLRRVRTPAGEKRFGMPIGSVITGNGRKLSNITLTDSEYAGFDKVRTSGGTELYIGKFDGDSSYVVTDANDEVLHEVRSLEKAFEWADNYAGTEGHDESAETYTPSPHGKRGNYKTTAATTRRLKNSSTEALLRERAISEEAATSGEVGDPGEYQHNIFLIDQELARRAPKAKGKPAGAVSNADKIANAATMYGAGSSQHREAQRRFGTKKEDNMGLQYKAVPIGNVTEVSDEEGVVEALVAVTGLKDNVNDIIEPGAFEKSLVSRTPKGVWHHNITESVSRTEEVKELLPGDPKLPETLPNGNPWPSNAGGLLVKTRFNLNTQRGRDAYEDVKFFGNDQEWSIGYNVPTGGATLDKKTGIRHINHMDLYEYSPVLFGAMPNARTVSVKSAQDTWHKITGEEALDIKSLFAELAQQELESKSKEKDKELEEDEEKLEDHDSTDEEVEDEAPDEEEDEEDKKAEKKSIQITAAGLDVIDAAVKSLSQLRDLFVNELKAQVGTFETKDQGLCAIAEDAGLTDILDLCEKFDSAVEASDADAMETVASSILDAVEEAAEDPDAETSELKRISGYIASAFQSIEPEEPSEEKQEDKTVSETKSEPVIVNVQEFLSQLS